MRILVTGGAGFIGSNFIHHLTHSGDSDTAACCPDSSLYGRQPTSPPEKLVNLDALTYAGDRRHLAGVDSNPAYGFVRADIADHEAVAAIFSSLRPDCVVHFAAESHVDRSIADPAVFVRSNVLGTQVLLEEARRRDTPRFVHVSTDEAYGSIADGSFREGDRLDPASPYAASKAGSDLLALAYHRTYGMDVVVSRCTNNFGPRQNPEKLIPKAILNALSDRAIPLYGSGQNVRDWLYVKDHCEAVRVVMERGKAGEVYNVAGGNEFPNVAIVQKVLTLLSRPSSLVEFVADRPGHDWRYSLDASKLLAVGWRPLVSLDAGLLATIDYYKGKGGAVAGRGA